MELCENKERDKLIREFKKCNLPYLPLAMHLQREQLKSYIFKHYFTKQYNLSFRCDEISKIFTFFNDGSEIPKSNNIKDFINIFCITDLKNLRKIIDAADLENAKIIRKNRHKLPDPTLDKQILTNRLKRFFHEIRDPENKVLSEEIQQKIIHELSFDDKDTQKDLLSWYLDELFFKFRFVKNDFKQKKSDMRDLDHIICAGCCSDIFITNDTRIKDFFDYAKNFIKDLPKITNKFNMAV